MDLTTIGAIVYAVVTAGAVAFQLALAAGAPWGEYAMGGRYPGRFPTGMRIGAVIQALLLVLLAVVVLSRAGLVLADWGQSAVLIWAVVAFSAASLVLNVITPSRKERLVWAPVALVMLASSLMVALTA